MDRVSELFREGYRGFVTIGFIDCGGGAQIHDGLVVGSGE